MKFLKAGHKKNLSNKELADKFENSMEKELDNLVKDKEKSFSNEKMETEDKTSLESSESNNKEKSPEKEVKYEDEEDTDSENEIITGVRCTKKRQKFTNDELFYDPNMDEQDEIWMNKQRKT